jgi:polysaccharide biosynthesis protein PslG
MLRLRTLLLIGTGILFACFCAQPFADYANAQAPAAAQSPLAVFGIGADDHTSRDLQKWIPQMAAIGIRNMRACRTLWSDVEPEEGQWRWSQLDGQLDTMAANHMECWALLYGGVPWDTKDRPGGFPSHDLQAWSDYVYQTVKHAKGRVKYWEVWNEPPNGTNDAPASDYGKLMSVTYDAVKAADPQSQVGMAAQSVNINYLEQAIKAGAKDHFDYITLHPYEILGSVNDNWGTESIFMHIVPTLRKMLAAQDPAREEAPVWFTEMGYDAGKDPALQAQALIKAYSMGIAEGVSVMNWFEGIDGDSGPMGLLDEGGKPRPSYTAMAQMIEHLGTHPHYLGWVLLNGRDYGFVFKTDKQAVMVAWTPGGVTDHVEFVQEAGIIDPLTAHATESRAVELTPSPILVENPPANLVSLAERNRMQPFPWDGDFSRAKSVSVRMGRTEVVEGLHPQRGDVVGADVVAYGGPARSGNVPGGPVFIVDPNFLSYTSVPIQISAVVRRGPENHPAKLVLEYESTSGFKKLPAREIPGNQEWYTAQWTINDAQFVSKWIFNFRFDLGDYLIKEVRVTKLDRDEARLK